MKLAAIINLWDGEELLAGAMDCLRSSVDLFIIVYQTVSNYGEIHDPTPNVNLSRFNVVWHEYVPGQFGGAENERNKRNVGLDIARSHSCTHFFHLDCDEYYENFPDAKDKFVRSGADGSVCQIVTYFKRPYWRIDGIENYFVPFIHRLKSDTRAGHSSYPFYCDPTRIINTGNVIQLDVIMHHFSWVRKNIERKARNSSAKCREAFFSQMLKDYNSMDLELSPGSYALREMDGRRIIITGDIFGIGKALQN